MAEVKARRTAGDNLMERLGTRRLINARGIATVLGGSPPSPYVQAAVQQADGGFYEIDDLQRRCGERVAQLLGAEAAWVTPGCFAALAQSAASVMAGDQPQQVSGIPTAPGSRNQFLLPTAMHYEYERFVTVVGGELRELGTANGFDRSDLATATGERTAAVAYVAHLEPTAGVLDLAATATAAHAHGLPVIVDAATQLHPERMTALLRSGADLVCFSAKYIGGPNAGGFVCGSAERIAQVAAHGFIAFEHDGGRAFGRGFKMNGRDLVSVVAAIEEWLDTDQDAHIRLQNERLDLIQDAIQQVAGVSCERHEPTLTSGVWASMRIAIDPTTGSRSAAEVGAALLAGEPPIFVEHSGEAIDVRTSALRSGEAEAVATRLRSVLEGN